MDIGTEGDPYVIEPIQEPVPGRKHDPPPEPSYEPAPERERDPELVPA